MELICTKKSTTFKILMYTHRDLIMQGYFSFACQLLHILQNASNDPKSRLQIYIGDGNNEAYDSGFVASNEPRMICGIMHYKPVHNEMKQIDKKNGILLIFTEGKNFR